MRSIARIEPVIHSKLILHIDHNINLKITESNLGKRRSQEGYRESRGWASHMAMTLRIRLATADIDPFSREFLYLRLSLSISPFSFDRIEIFVSHRRTSASVSEKKRCKIYKWLKRCG